MKGGRRMEVLKFCFVFAVFFVVVVDGLNIWPRPKSVYRGSISMYITKDFDLVIDGGGYKDESGILRDGFSRFLDVVHLGHVVDGVVSNADRFRVLKGLFVSVVSPDEKLQHGIDESYKLGIPATGKPSYAHLEAQTIYGALHGLQTFSQLCNFNFTSRVIEVGLTPWTIFDQPRFPYRGILIDTSRHYQTLPMIKRVIDAMAYTKLNVLHWHIVDTQSFPLEIPSYPKLWNGAYSLTERYTMSDASEIVMYAQRRGINVLAEIDVPGHTQSWGYGYPSLWPSSDCPEPLDVSNEFTFQLISGILADFSKVFKFKFIHLGGDEVNTSCWETTPHVKNWLKKQGFNASQAYEYFVLRAQKIALSHGYEVVNWEETFNNFGNKLSRKTVVQNWLRGGLAQKVVESGLRCIVSNQDKWYLDHLDAYWQNVYMNEPLTNITNPQHQKLVLGGEICIWGEHIDASDLEQTIWPRAAAAAERLWTPYEMLAKDPREVTSRLAHFRCLLNRRGVAAAPLAGPGRMVPLDPGSCYHQ